MVKSEYEGQTNISMVWCTVFTVMVLLFYFIYVGRMFLFVLSF